MYERPQEDFDLVRDFLGVPLAHDQPETLKSQMADSITWLARVGYLKRTAEREYRQKKNQYLLPKDKSYTDLDRETSVNAQCAEIYYDYGLLEDYEKVLSVRISSCQTLINSHMVEVKRGL